MPAGVDTTIFGLDSTLLRFYVNSFKYPNGSPVLSGTVTVLLTEILSPGDMINNRASTMMASGEILQSCGLIKVSASIGGEDLITNGYGVGFIQKDTSDALMGLFYAATSKDDSMTIWTQSEIPYQHGTKKIKTSEIINDTLRTIYTKCFFFDNFNTFSYINCNWFTHFNTPKVGLSVILPDGTFNATNTQLFLVLPKTNAGWTGNAVLSNMGGLGKFDSSYNPVNHKLMLKTVGDTAVAPPGYNYELVAIANKGGKYYYWSTSGVVPYNNLVLNATMAEAPKDSITLWLKKL